MHSQKSTDKSAHHEHSEACRKTRKKASDEGQNQCIDDYTLSAFSVRQKSPYMRTRDDSNRCYAGQHTFVHCRELQIAFGYGENETYAESFKRSGGYDDSRDENENIIECPEP
jgi:hypothetical protein